MRKWTSFLNAFVWSCIYTTILLTCNTCILKRSLREELNSRINKIEYSSLSLEELKQLKSFEYELNKKKFYDNWKRKQVEDYNHALNYAILNGDFPANANVMPAPILEL
jgi:hypothetical protein